MHLVLMTQYRHSIDCSCQSQDTPSGAANSYAQWAVPTLLTARNESMPLLRRAAVTIFGEKKMTALRFDQFEHWEADL